MTKLDMLFYNEIEALKNKLYESETIAEQCRMDLTALKNDARICAEFAKTITYKKGVGNRGTMEAARRILEATKENRDE